MKGERKRVAGDLSRAEAERAIYIDFEGFVKESPTLLGILIEGRFEQVVLDVELREAANAKELRVSTILDEGERLLDHSQREKRYIVAYSLIEQQQFLQWAGLDIMSQYRNARTVARRWRAKFHPETRANGNGLKDYFELIGVERRKYLGSKNSTKWITSVRNGLRARRTFEKLTGTQKAFWTKLLEHNRIDCEGMRCLMLRAASELELGRANLIEM